MQRAGETEALLLVHTPLAAAEAIGRLKGADFIYVEPNYIYPHQSNDSYFTNGLLWGMYGASATPANQYGSGAAVAWAAGHTGSASVAVGVIDEGIQFDNPDLAGQVRTNSYEVANDGIDNNGYIDDVHSWDFDGNNSTIYDGGTRSSSDDHGTHVSGTIGTKANNAQGVAGMNWNITLISCKFLGRRIGTTADVVKAVDYRNSLKIYHNMNIVVSNNSWGGGGFSQALYDAVSRADGKKSCSRPRPVTAAATAWATATTPCPVTRPKWTCPTSSP